ncbi:3-phosphoshikimate 1-carboxyvinyltransferase [Gracilibacillus halophilus YIM-C55.5]|uniref:3-phosphoshikimate 1-carboxyvinyltransferase n=1 Tax=Gracilibacillus halophilus YIM-C55.5 TaxID=1308866 RepID=N4WAJ7_9BACI|nr:3-phosphoshikimate 1-carboxyvinyltransferase [Gracilibacillus halophilus]ENH97333.1 3-phosphoshikimate 1-carboxyvinyltransferase [Gracilibacillus halophilus YIM-C55.5]
MVSKKRLHFQDQSLSGTISVPGDKSISHRAVMFASLAEGKATITNFLAGEDCLSTIAAFQKMGVTIERFDDTVVVESNGIQSLQEPSEPIDLGNSGTTARLLMGILAGLPYHFSLYGDASLSKRPMDRIIVPLHQMGAKIDGRDNGRLLPISIRGGQLQPINYHPPVKSAQVKSGVLLAGLLAKGSTSVTETTKTRDHTENMLQAFGARLQTNDNQVTIEGEQSLKACDIEVPGDISSAAFFLVAAAITPNSSVTIQDVGLNPTRTGIVEVLQQMKVDIQVNHQRTVGGEPIGDITVNASSIQGTTIDGDIIPRIIDEIPIIALLATQAKGETVIKDAEELRYKETDRIESVVNTLQQFGAHIEGTHDGMIIKGESQLHGCDVHSYGDHRIGMMIAIASLLVEDEVILRDQDCIAVSYPQFFDDLQKLLS